MKKQNRNKYLIFCLVAISAQAVYFMLPHRLGQSQKKTESPGAVFIVANNLDAGAGSLRQAITDANASAGTDTIQFAIGTGTAQINIDTALPVITGAVTIDGTTQPGFAGTPLIIVRRNNAPIAANGLHLTGGASSIRGIAAIRFSSGSAIVFEGAGGNAITGSFIGIDPRDEGINLFSNNNGILVLNSPNNTIGGSTDAARNVIGRNTDGIEISGAASTGNVVTGNYIGLRSNGNDAARNVNGVFLNAAPNNRVGGTTPGERNVISGNVDLTVPVALGTGINIIGPATGNVIQGNYIGTDFTGTIARPNEDGIVIRDAASTTLGGSTGTTPGGGCTGTCNLITGNRRFPVSASNAQGTVLEGNFVNLHPDGTTMLVPPPTVTVGISLQSSANTRVGGTTPASRNVIVSTGGSSLALINSPNCIVSGNFVGTDTTGTVALGNATAGIALSNLPAPGQPNSAMIRVGGTTPGERNLISGGNQTGIRLGGSFNTVEGNFIGTDVTGTLDLGNSLDGVLILGATSHTIGTPTGTTLGGACTGGCNVISGNGRDGIRIEGPTASNNHVDYSYVGLNAAGTASLLNTGDAISLRNGTNQNIIGRVPGPATAPITESEPAANPSGGGLCLRNDDGDTITLQGPPAVGTPIVCRTARGSSPPPGETVELVQNNFSPGVTYLQGSHGTSIFLRTALARANAGFNFGTDERIVLFNAVVSDAPCSPAALPGDLIANGYIRLFGPAADQYPFNNTLGPFLVNLKVDGIFPLEEADSGIEIHGFDTTIGGIETYRRALTGENEPASPFRVNAGHRNQIAFSQATQRFPASSTNIPGPISVAPGAQDGIETPVIESVTLNPDLSLRFVFSQHNPLDRDYQWDLYGVDETVLSLGAEREVSRRLLLSGVFTGQQLDRAIADVSVPPFEAIGLHLGTTFFALTATERFGANRPDGSSEPDGETLGSTSEMSAMVSTPGITVSGRVTTPDGRGLRNARVSITDNFSGLRRTASTTSFGFYSFDDVRVFRTYTIGVSSKLFRFASRPIDVFYDNLVNVNFVGTE